MPFNIAGLHYAFKVGIRKGDSGGKQTEERRFDVDEGQRFEMENVVFEVIRLKGRECQILEGNVCTVFAFDNTQKCVASGVVEV